MTCKERSEHLDRLLVLQREALPGQRLGLAADREGSDFLPVGQVLMLASMDCSVDMLEAVIRDSRQRDLAVAR